MAIDALKKYLIAELLTARHELQDAAPQTLTTQLITDWHTKWHKIINKAIRVGGNVGLYAFSHASQGPDNAPPEVVADVRTELVKLVDLLRFGVDSTQVIESALQENIHRSADSKLAQLLGEFNRIKDTAPNAAAVIFRTILILVIHLRAKQLNDAGKLAGHKHLATNTNFDLSKAIDAAKAEGIFDRGDTKFLELFAPSGKALFDNVAHSVGPSAMVDKEHLATVIEPLNKLLSYLRW
jgi:hypothetical protein